MKRFLLSVLCPLLLALPAQAAFVYSGLQNIAIPTDFFGIFIDIDNAVTSGTDFAGADINPFLGGSGINNNADFQPARTGTNFDDAIIRLPSGALISSALNFSTGIGTSGNPNSHMGAGGNQFFPGSEGFLGFKFNKNDSSGPFFGWIRLVFTNATAGGLIKDWVYDDSGAPILAGAPEPGRVVFLFLGLLALAQRRRRR
ncbi:MAG: hypothetical protein JNG86_11150 [Verrucomicrobiaceae bacterium]|nr:hypothetical protein [Verrucomicrobiaceae bacterium]